MVVPAPLKVPSRTWAEVDLGAIRHNVRTLKRRAGAALLMAVVKANAYGHGAVPVARATLEAGADSLAVATLEEGAELRRAGIEAPVLVFTDLLPDGLALSKANRLQVTAHSLPSAKRIASYPGLEAHLKVNTGMNRWGVEPEEAGEACKILGDRLAGVYTISPPPTLTRKRPATNSMPLTQCSPRGTSAAFPFTLRTLPAHSGTPPHVTIASGPA